MIKEHMTYDQTSTCKKKMEERRRITDKNANKQKIRTRENQKTYDLKQNGEVQHCSTENNSKKTLFFI